jgi:hypothetical protein
MFDSNQLNKVFRGNDARAYTRVMELRENPKPPHPPLTGSGEPDGERDAFGWRPEPGNLDGEDRMEEFFNQVFGEFGPGGRPREKAPTRSDTTPSPPCRPAPARG